jgi:lysine 6-dehydrogenase
MRALIIGGSGKMGNAVAWDLARDDEVEAVGIADRRSAVLRGVQRSINSSKLKMHLLDITDREQTGRLMQEYDVGVIALADRKANYRAVEAAIETGLDTVDILEEYHRRPDPFGAEDLEIPRQMSLEEYGEWLHERAVERDVLLLDGMGFAPGLSNITLGDGIRRMDRAESAIARVGGVPTNEARGKYPLDYMITWAFDHVLREYMVQVEVIRDGKVMEVPALSDRETFRFSQLGRDEELECAVTRGMPSFIFTRPQLSEFAEKTIRWPGHYQDIDVLKECGMLDLTPVRCAGVGIAPRDFLSAVMSPMLSPLEGDTDVCIMWNTVMGTHHGHPLRIDYYLWEGADEENGISAMGRVTGFPAAIAARLIAKGVIRQKGVIAPEDAIDEKAYRTFVQELAKRNITILEVPEAAH